MILLSAPTPLQHGTYHAHMFLHNSRSSTTGGERFSELFAGVRVRTVLVQTSILPFFLWRKSAPKMRCFVEEWEVVTRLWG